MIEVNKAELGELSAEMSCLSLAFPETDNDCVTMKVKLKLMMLPTT